MDAAALNRREVMANKYEVVRFAADGCGGEQVPGGHSDGDVVAYCDTLGAAKDEARRLARGGRSRGFGAWTPAGEGEIIAYGDSKHSGCGGYLVRLADGQ